MPGHGEKRNKPNIFSVISEKLEGLGITISDELEASLRDLDTAVKVVCVTPDLGESVREMGESPREHTVMVRVDEDTLQKLDAWVESGAVKSRSEAAALFIREGLQVRAEELSELEDALKKVDEAKRKLREKAKTVFGETSSKDQEDL
jgi:Arc/MetJ-type ribon-helix-helix transcriptional regulator